MAKKHIHTAGLTGKELEKQIKRMKISKVNQAKRYTRSKAGNFFYILFLLLAAAFSVLSSVGSL